MIEFYETYLKICCIVGLSEVRLKDEYSIIFDDLSSFLRGPSMGSLNQLRNKLSNLIKHEKAYLPKFNSIIDTKSLTKIIEIRNDLSHGYEPSISVANDLLFQLSDNFENFIKRIWMSLDFIVFFPIRSDYNGENFISFGPIFNGESANLINTTYLSKEPLISKNIYLVDNENNLLKYLSLHPFLVAGVGINPNSWDLFMFDGCKIDTKVENIKGNEVLRYIDIRAGKRNIKVSNELNISELNLQRISYEHVS